jgi:Kef-type K+ transport system membrane component KefB
VIPSLTLLQLVAILLVCAATSRALALLRQPAVVGQMLAGILIGPSLLGLWPAWQHLLFPAASVRVIDALGELGVVLFMFGVGTGLDLSLLRAHLRSTAAVSAASVVVPLAAGAVVASALLGDARLFPPTIGPAVAVGFLAVALAITAFPVMARIIDETGIAGSAVANTSLAAGSVTDAVAWCLLAILLAAMAGSARGAAVAAGAALGLAGLTLLARRAPVANLLTRYVAAWPAAPLLWPALLLVAWASSAAGLHPAFGAFVVGLAVPRVAAVDDQVRRLGPIVTNVLLPLFFVSAGLSTRVGLLLGPGLPLIGLVLLLTACLSKGGSCWLAARLSGRTPREAFGIGALMNARGLVELVVLTIGLQRGVITPALFSIMVLVAVITTMTASLVLRAALPGQVVASEEGAARAPRPGSGRSLRWPPMSDPAAAE